MVGESPLHAVNWHDNRSVSLLSNYTGAYPVIDVDGWDGKQIIRIPSPSIVREYNENKGRVDLLDSVIALYHNNIKSKKWYHKLMSYSVMSIVIIWSL